VKKNKLQIGFGISNGEDVKRLKDYCDGVIVGSAVIKLLNDKNGIKLSAKFDF
jgi:tryptophan synthase alpha subunit